MSNQYFSQINNPTIPSSLQMWRDRKKVSCLIGSKCSKCKNVFFPEKLVCPYCQIKINEQFKFKGKGKIINFEKNNIPQTVVMGFRDVMPRIFGIIQLEEGPIILGEIVDNNEIKLGDDVVSVVRRLSRLQNTMWNYGVKWTMKS